MVKACRKASKVIIRDFGEVENLQVSLKGPGDYVTASDKKESYMRAFSGEVSRHIASFLDGDHDSIPTIYKMFEDVCEANGLLLVKVKIYESGDALRANLYLTGTKYLVLRNYRASDAVTLAVYYNIPILVRKNMLQDPMEKSPEYYKAN